MAFRKAENRVKVEGYLSEIDLKNGSYENGGASVEYIGGSIKVLVEQEINGKKEDLEIPVHMFAPKLTKKGSVNPAYESAEKVMKEYVSIASCGSKEQADKVRITSGEIRMNEFVGQNTQIVSQPRVNASFISKATGEFTPEAKFTLEFVVSKVTLATDADGVELDPPRLNLEVIVPQYTPDTATAMKVDVVPLVATNPNVIDAINQYWNAGETFRASGRLNFSSRTEKIVEQQGFGEAIERVRTVNLSELIVTGGSEAPLEGDFAFDMDDIRAGMELRAKNLEDMKSGKKSTTKQTPAANGSKGTKDLGF